MLLSSSGDAMPQQSAPTDRTQVADRMDSPVVNLGTGYKRRSRKRTKKARPFQFSLRQLHLAYVVTALLSVLVVYVMALRVEHVKGDSLGRGAYIVRPAICPKLIVLNYQTHKSAPTQYSMNVVFFDDPDDSRVAH